MVTKEMEGEKSPFVCFEDLLDLVPYKCLDYDNVIYICFDKQFVFTTLSGLFQGMLDAPKKSCIDVFRHNIELTNQEITLYKKELIEMYGRLGIIDNKEKVSE